MNDKIIIEVDKELKDLIPSFLENRKNDIEQLKLALDKNDFKKILFISHQLKGVGGGYGFNLMSEIAAEIEDSSADKNSHTIKRKIKELDNYLMHVEIKYH